MKDEVSKDDLLARLKKNLAAEGESVPAAEDDHPKYADDLIPEVEPTKRAPEEVELDQAIKNYPLGDAYRRWVPKSSTHTKASNGEVVVRCPNPAHEDKHPSAWYKPSMNVGYCIACDLGWDIYDLYAWSRGYPVPGYKDRETFPRMRIDMALELGFTVTSTGGKDYASMEATPERPESPQPVENAGDDEADTVRGLSLVPDDDEDDDYDDPESTLEAVPIDYAYILGIDDDDVEPTFLDELMKECSRDDQPVEFYFMLGLMVLGLATGNDIRLADSMAVRPNLMVCLVGGSGSGKSRAVSNIRRLLHESLPLDRDTGSGVRVIRDPSSGEVLLPLFQHLNAEGVVDDAVPVRGFVEVPELWALAAQGNRAGAKLKPVLMDLYDDPNPGSSGIRAGIVEPKSTFMALATTTQNKLLAELLSSSDANSGFTNRFLFVNGVRKPLLSWGGAKLDFTAASRKLREVRAWASPSRDLKFTGPALEMWDKFFHDELVPLKLDEDRPTFARSDLLFKKLMLLFSINRRCDEIDVASVAQALELWPYIRSAYGFVDYQTTTKIEVRETEEIDTKILKVIEQLTKAQVARKEERKLPTERELMRILGVWNKRSKVTKDVYLKRMDVLERLGYFQRVRNGQAVQVRLIK